jgi:hypothetical protein
MELSMDKRKILTDDQELRLKILSEKLNYLTDIQGVNDQSAPLLVLADQIGHAIENNSLSLKDSSLDHYICMGIRHGLFGAEARDNASIEDVFTDLRVSINNEDE